jgi:lipopolysaccharide transport system ATP-binding protein
MSWRLPENREFPRHRRSGSASSARDGGGSIRLAGKTCVPAPDFLPGLGFHRFGIDGTRVEPTRFARHESAMHASQAIITVENLSKKYLLGHKSGDRGNYAMLRDVVGREIRSFARKTVDVVRGRQVVQGNEVEEFWALKDVSFEVERGEVLGIIGRNGAGKSTLLKILSRITEPTGGRVVLRGRVASLLEVGTGFHPELTGRENIFLNGAILGMTRSEIKRRFDEIVDFAEVEKFLDTPVKRYSSGMYVRLAFAVAAHLEPEILVVDEVLAVGDAEFQKKCLGKMDAVSRREGRTVVFVSHNMSAITQLTARAVVLSEGGVQFIGPSGEAVPRYVSEKQRDGTVEYDTRANKESRFGTGEARILSLRFDRDRPNFEFREPIPYVIRLKALHTVSRFCASMTVYTSEGFPVGNCFSSEIDGMAAGEEREVVVTLSADLAPGSYLCAVAVGVGDNRTRRTVYDRVSDILCFEVLPERVRGGGTAEWQRSWGSVVFRDFAIAALPAEVAQSEASLQCLDAAAV